MMKLNRRVRLSAIFAALVLVGISGCGDDTASAGSGGSGGSGQSVTINEPADGSTVEIPFTLSLDSTAELGTTDSGKNHVHLYFDGNDSQYEVIESDTMEITEDSPAVAGLRSGEHELNISLRNADHSAAGFETSINVQVGNDGGEAPADPGTGGGY
ncbi:hypothetical protein [Actinophytocola sp.]|uniref:hypothetical protein n=1 Tax=Actinophytocola sp. TaxID=1872138 RepID=UPI002ED68F07